MKLRKVRTRFISASPMFAVRKFLTVRVPYEKLGLNRSDYLTEKDIMEMFEFDKKRDSGFQDHYCFIERNVDENGIAKQINMNIRDTSKYTWHDEDPKYTSTEPSHKLYFHQNDRIYDISFRVGYPNPEWTYESDFDVPYWLYDDDPEKSTYSCDLLNDDKEEYLELLTKHANYKDLCWGLYGDEHENELLTDLASLSQYTKTNYVEIKNDFVQITFSCYRDKENIDEFVRDFKRIIKKHKIKL